MQQHADAVSTRSCQCVAPALPTERSTTHTRPPAATVMVLLLAAIRRRRVRMRQRCGGLHAQISNGRDKRTIGQRQRTADKRAPKAAIPPPGKKRKQTTGQTDRQRTTQSGISDNQTDRQRQRTTDNTAPKQTDRHRSRPKKESRTTGQTDRPDSGQQDPQTDRHCPLRRPQTLYASSPLGE